MHPLGDVAAYPMIEGGWDVFPDMAEEVEFADVDGLPGPLYPKEGDVGGAPLLLETVNAATCGAAPKAVGGAPELDSTGYHGVVEQIRDVPGLHFMEGGKPTVLVESLPREVEGSPYYLAIVLH